MEETNNKRLLFVQFSDSAFKRHSSCDRYLDAFYDKYRWFGYYKGSRNIELPKWVAEISYFADGYDKEIYYVSTTVDELDPIIAGGSYDFVLFSLMNCNQSLIEPLLRRHPRQLFVVGGYDRTFLDRLAERNINMLLCRSTMDAATILSVDYRFGTDYSLFKGEQVIPRLTMSYGCLHKCKFCIVPHEKIVEVEDCYINQQVDSFDDLDYKLIYIDDKTFGQADNWNRVGGIAYNITSLRDGFSGFIVQTTTGMVARKAEDFRRGDVKVAEIGLETYNDGILRAYNKPSSQKLTDEAVDAAYENNLMLIANLIIGLPEETEDTYKRTFDYVMPLLENGKLMGLNTAIYTDYGNDENLGEIDFSESGGIDMHRKWWDLFNNTAADIVRGQKTGC